MPIQKVGSRIKNTNTTVKVPNTGHGFKTRTVYNSSNGTGESVNWKLDLYRFKNLSYAQVLKAAVQHKNVEVRTDSSTKGKVRDVALKKETIKVIQSSITAKKVLTKSSSAHSPHNHKVNLKKGQAKLNQHHPVKNYI